MNKKVLTLCAGFLLAGGLATSAFATDVTAETFKGAIKNGVLNIGDLKLTDNVINLKGSVDLSNESAKYVIIREGAEGIVLTSDGEEVKFTGNIVVAADGFTIKNMSITNVPEAGIGGYWQKAAISVFADEVTITGNKISAGTEASGALSNGIMLFPQTKEATYSKITGNTLSGFDAKVDPYYSSAIKFIRQLRVKIKQEIRWLTLHYWALATTEQRPLQMHWTRRH